MNFDEYLISKRIDAVAFSKAEPALFRQWKKEFEEMHPNSFTVQKLNLINPIRRKYLLNADTASPASQQGPGPSVPPAARPGKPVIKPKPKLN